MWVYLWDQTLVNGWWGGSWGGGYICKYKPNSTTACTARPEWATFAIISSYSPANSQTSYPQWLSLMFDKDELTYKCSCAWCFSWRNCGSYICGTASCWLAEIAFFWDVPSGKYTIGYVVVWWGGGGWNWWWWWGWWWGWWDVLIWEYKWNLTSFNIVIWQWWIWGCWSSCTNWKDGTYSCFYNYIAKWWLGGTASWCWWTSWSGIAWYHSSSIYSSWWWGGASGAWCVYHWWTGCVWYWWWGWAWRYASCWQNWLWKDWWWNWWYWSSLEATSATNCWWWWGWWASGCKSGANWGNWIVKLCYLTNGCNWFSCATGGIKSVEWNYTVHTFTSDWTFTIVN